MTKHPVFDCKYARNLFCLSVSDLCVYIWKTSPSQTLPHYQNKTIYDTDGTPIAAEHINGYLMDGPDVWVESRTKPICDVPVMGIGNKPIDGGNYLSLKEEMEDFIKKEPLSAKYFRPWYGAEEFINGKERFCLWLGDCSQAELFKMPKCLKRIQAVRDFRLASKSEGTRKIADKPTRFHVENMPKGNYLLVPQTSSENRKYIPIGFMSPESLCSNAARIVPDASLYHFGVLTSIVHMAWMRIVTGRMKSDYQYATNIVYNNFPWPEIDNVANVKVLVRQAKLGTTCEMKGVRTDKKSTVS